MNSVTLDHVSYALSLTVGAMSILFVGAVTCVAVSILLINKFGENDE